MNFEKSTPEDYRQKTADTLRSFRNEKEGRVEGAVKNFLGISGKQKAEKFLAKEQDTAEYQNAKDKKNNDFVNNPEILEKKANLERIESEKAADLERRESEEKEAINIIVKALLSTGKEIVRLEELVGYWERARESSSSNKQECLSKYKAELELAHSEEEEIQKSIDDKGLDQGKIIRAMIDSPLSGKYDSWEKLPIGVASRYLQEFKNITEEQRSRFKEECDDDYRERHRVLRGGHDDHGWMD